MRLAALVVLLLLTAGVGAQSIDLLPWLNTASQYGGAVAASIIGTVLLIQNWRMATNTRTKFKEQVEAQAIAFSEQVSELVEKQDALTKTMRDGLHSLRDNQTAETLAHTKALGALDARLASVEGQLRVFMRHAEKRSDD